MTNICLECIGDDFARAKAEKMARKLKCGLCKSVGNAITVADLADLIENDLREYYEHGEFVPHYSFDSDKPDYEQEGESLIDILQQELEIDFDPAKELAAVLIDRDPAYPPDGDEPFFASDQNYKLRWMTSWPYSNAWGQFSQRIKHEQRFFDAEARQILEQVLGAPGTKKVSELPILEIGPDARVSRVFRARRARTESDARRMLETPARELGPPPSERATAGRLNAAGISVFYGALSADTAAAEVRPSVGGVIVVGRFLLQRSLRLLDLTQIHAGFTGSVFNPEYADRAARLRFLKGFHRLIARPIQVDDEPLEYLPTQVVAEYVSNVLGLDGLLYASAQVGAIPPDRSDEDGYFRPSELDEAELHQHNVVLFRVATETPNLDGGKPAREGLSQLGSPNMPDLAFEDGSGEVWRITAISHEHERVYLRDPRDTEDF